MFSKFLVKKFVQHYEDVKNDKVRSSYGFLGGTIGIIVNIILFVIKLSVGLIVNSIAVTADAFNNLTDSASSLITIVGFKLSNMPADEEHPFGHGRLEYISALIVAFMVMFVGFQFTKSSYDRIMNPSSVEFEVIPFALMVVSVFTKVWLSRFNRFIGNTIDSTALKASSVDALGDVIITSTVAFSLLLSKFSSFPIDGYIGIAVALFILYSGFKLVRETLNPLLGESPDKELVENIKTSVLNYKHIDGVHDLIIHNYGPGKCMASIHAEVPADISIVEIHDIIDEAEREISEKLNIYLVIHMDPINVHDEEVHQTKEELLGVLKEFPVVKSIHDFRVVGEGEHKNLIFDVVVDSSMKLNNDAEEKLKDDICRGVKRSYPYYNCNITLDKDFTHL
jgi:cation diffusion facilitator family transporter